MQIRLDTTSPMPIYAQVMEQIRWAISIGELVVGAQLPTVRQLAVELRINPNTVARAYNDLERLGMIATQQGRGTFVISGREKAPEAERRALLKQFARSMVAEAGALGYTPAELAQEILNITGQEDKKDA